MHEMSLAASMLQIIEDAAAEQGFSKVRTVWMEVGQLSCVEKNALHFCFSAVVDGTVAHDAKLEMIDIAGIGWCGQCACEIAIGSLFEHCSVCGNYAIEVIRGSEMRIRELEVE